MVSRGLEAISLTLIKKLDTNFEFSGFSDQVSQRGTFSVSDDFGKELCLQMLHFNICSGIGLLNGNGSNLGFLR